MEESTASALLRRVEKLEAECRRLHRQARRGRNLVGSVALVTLLLVVSLSAAHEAQEIVAAEGFVLHGKDGKSMAALRLNREGLPYLAFFDKNQRIRMHLALDDGEVRLILQDKDAAPRLISYLDSDGMPGITLFKSENAPGLSFFNEKRGYEMRLNIGKESGPGLTLFENGIQVRRIGITPDRQEKP